MFRLIMITALTFMASTFPAFADGGVEVILAPRLQALEANIDRIEQTREKRFRKNQHYDHSAATSPRRFANSRYRDVAWANELLVPDETNYGVRNLLSALVGESLERAGIDMTGMIIRVKLDKLRVSAHPLARLHGASTYASGSMALVDATSGQIVRSADIAANPVVNPTVNMGYKGPDFAFEDTDSTRRVGPALAYFVMKGLEKLYDGSEFPRPVSVIYSR